MSLRTRSVQTVSLSCLPFPYGPRPKTDVLQSIEKHILLLDTLIAKHDEFSANFHNVATAVLKLDEDAVDTMAVLLRDMVPLCEMKNLEDFTDKFDTAIEKYSAP